MAKNPKDDDEAKRGGLLGDGAARASEPVTYLPQDGDPAKTRWRGTMFHANIPVAISDPDMLAAARSNKFFHVGEGAPHVVVEETLEPKTPEQYRAHVVGWLKTVETMRELDDKWEAEEVLRIHVGAGTDDIEYLKTLLGPKREELRKAGGFPRDPQLRTTEYPT